MSREPYSGSERKLLLAFDVGTTFSGISYSILDPGKVPEISGVTKFPGQERAGGDAKIPSVLYYSTEDGRVRAAGAEAERDGVDIMAEEEGWVRVEWFKLHFRPKTKESAAARNYLRPLLLGKIAVEVMSDFLKYLNTCAKQYIEEVHPGIGSSLWNGSEIHYILSHPNGWEGPQKSLMRQAAQMAGLITPQGRNQVTYITEGEASLNRCIEKGLMTNAIRNGDGITIVDAGGGTVDISAYACKPDGKTFEEIAESQCHFKGSIFVTRYAKNHLETLLQGSKFHRDIPEILKYFDKSTKCSFRDPNDPHFIRFGSVRDKDPELRIVGGRLRLEGTVVASFFEPSIKCIIESVLEQRRIAHKPISSVFLVGGFAANDYLFSRVKEGLEPHGLHVYRPDTQVNKVVADGAISGILDKPVQTRVSRFAYGVECAISYNPVAPEHRKRRNKRYEAYSGETMLPGTFSTILRRNTQVTETEEFRCSYTNESLNPWCLNTMQHNILCYRGNLPKHRHRWIDNDPTNFRDVCTITADLSGLPIPLCRGPKGSYYEVTVDVVLLFGCTELKAQIAWMENGMEKRGPAEIIYDTDV